MTEILIKRLSKDVALPKYETEGSSGLDLAANTDKQIKILPGKIEIIPTGLAVAIPKNFEIQIRPRSGLAAKSQISVLNTPGTIDADYRGELKVILINLSDKIFVVEKGFWPVTNFPETTTFESIKSVCLKIYVANLDVGF